jgi:hypothetical protein
MDEISELYQCGVSLQAIARITGRSFMAVRGELIRLGLHRPKHKHVRDGQATCRGCHRLKPAEEFPALVYGSYWCRECRQQMVHTSTLRRLGSSAEEYQQLLQQQDGKCAICGTCEGHRSSRGQTCKLALDHDHASGKARGLLCNNCNRGLGRFRDSLSLLEAAVRYLQGGQQSGKSRSHINC